MRGPAATEFRLLPARFVTMDDEQRQAAVAALADLLSESCEASTGASGERAAATATLDLTNSSAEQRARTG